MTDKQPEAPRLADEWQRKTQREADRQNSAYDRYGTGNTPETVDPLGSKMAAELRRLHAENETLTLYKSLADEYGLSIFKDLKDLGDAGSDVQLLRMGYAAARLEIESLKAQLAGRAKEQADELAVAPTTQPAPQQEAQEPAAVVVPCHTPSGKRVALYSAKQDLPIGTQLYTAPQPSPAAQGDALDAERLDWLLLRISGAEFRRIGVHYSGNARRADVDAARKQGANHD